MVDPAKVLGFLDVAGDWDRSLAFVLAGAVGTASLGFWFVERQWTAPLFARDIDRRLVVGAALFGIGWGLVGLCPGPALAALAIAPAQLALFVAAMFVGMVPLCRTAFLSKVDNPYYQTVGLDTKRKPIR